MLPRSILSEVKAARGGSWTGFEVERQESRKEQLRCSTGYSIHFDSKAISTPCLISRVLKV